MSEQETDISILNGCIEKKPASQKALYSKYAYKMMGVCLRYCTSREEAEDILQDAFIKIFTKITSFKKDGSFEGWIRTIVVRTAIDHFNTNKKKYDELAYEELKEMGDFTYNETLEQISTDELLEMINEMPEGYRIVLNLYAIEGYNHKEISEMLNISEGTSKSQLSRARKHLEIILIKKNRVPHE
jgi:RNA polymerase sigma factor (sigma-70 family)